MDEGEQDVETLLEVDLTEDQEVRTDTSLPETTAEGYGSAWCDRARGYAR